MIFADEENQQPTEDNTDTTPEGTGGETKPKKKNILIPIIAGVVVLLIACGAALYFMLSSSETTEDEKKEERKAIAEKVVYFELPDILVNLHDPSGRYGGLLKISLYLELENEGDVDHVERLKPKIIDQFQLYLRGLKTKDISGATGLQRLREELLNLANGVTDPITVRSVLFREMLVQ